MGEYIDKVTQSRIDTAHPAVREELREILSEVNTRLSGKAKCRLSYVLRSFEEQAALYAQGRETLANINALRKKAGMPPLQAAEGRKKITNASAGLSIHQYGLACDIVLMVDSNGDGKPESASWDTRTDFDKDGQSDWLEVVSVFKKRGWSWGGDWSGFKDLPHFEKTFGHKASDLLLLRKAGKLLSGGYVALT